MPMLIPDAIERPTSNTAAVQKKAMDMLIKHVVEWLTQDGGEVGDEAELREQLDDALGGSGLRNGYEAAKTLDQSYCWSPDADLVETLEAYSVWLMTAEDDAVRAWVKDCDVKPTHKVGDTVSALWGGEKLTGPIVKIYEDTAKYVIHRPGDQPECGALVAYENVVSIA